jgi:hypothetical protein
LSEKKSFIDFNFSTIFEFRSAPSLFSTGSIAAATSAKALPATAVVSSGMNSFSSSPYS